MHEVSHRLHAIYFNMLILSIDTSTRGCSVAIHHHSHLIATNELYTDRSSSAMLTVLIDQVVTNAGFSLSQLDAVAVAKGPGSYTGLRVAVSTAKGLCFALDKPLIAINTLEGMAMQVKPYFAHSSYFCPMIDARRMEVYTAVYDFNGIEIVPTNALILDANSYIDLLKDHQIVFFGDGCSKFESLVTQHKNAVFIKDEIKPSAKTIGLLAGKSFENQYFENLANFEPYYLKDFMSPPAKKKTFLANQ